MRTLPIPRNTRRGLTLVEVLVASVVFLVAISGLVTLSLTSSRLMTIQREEQIALYAAESAINEMRASPFTTTTGEKIVTAFNKETRAVTGLGTGNPRDYLRLSAPVISGGDGFKVANELGIMIINEETPNEYDFGDVDGDGDLDFPVDLNGNGVFTDAAAAAVVGQSFFPANLWVGSSGAGTSAIPLDSMGLVPIVVVVRWWSAAGQEQRIQLMTAITDR